MASIVACEQMGMPSAGDARRRGSDLVWQPAGTVSEATCAFVTDRVFVTETKATAHRLRRPWGTS